MGSGASSTNFTERQVHDLTIKFCAMDRNGDGKVSIDELLAMHHELDGENFDEERIRGTFGKIDRNGSGFIDMREYLVEKGMAEDEAFEQVRHVLPEMVCASDDQGKTTTIVKELTNNVQSMVEQVEEQVQAVTRSQSQEDPQAAINALDGSQGRFHSTPVNPENNVSAILEFFKKYRRAAPQAVVQLMKKKKFQYTHREVLCQVEVPITEHLTQPMPDEGGLAGGFKTTCPGQEGIERFLSRQNQDSSLALFLGVQLHRSLIFLGNAIVNYSGALPNMPESGEFVFKVKMTVPADDAHPESLMVLDQEEGLCYLDRPLARCYINQAAIEADQEYTPCAIDNNNGIFQLYSLDLDEPAADNLVKIALDELVSKHTNWNRSEGGVAAEGAPEPAAAAEGEGAPTPAPEPAFAEGEGEAPPAEGEAAPAAP